MKATLFPIALALIGLLAWRVYSPSPDAAADTTVTLQQPITSEQLDPNQSDPCADALTTIEINRCVWDNYESADSDLNSMWALVMSTLEDNPDLADLMDATRSAQRAWIAFRDADCQEAVGAFWGDGSGARTGIGSCLAGMTEDRIVTLGERFRNFGGNEEIDDILARYQPR